MHRAKLLDRRPTSLTTGGFPVRSDVFIHNLEPFTLESLRRAIEQGLVPSGLDFAGDDNSIVVLRFTRARAGEAEEREAAAGIPERWRIVPMFEMSVASTH